MFLRIFLILISLIIMIGAIVCTKVLQIQYLITESKKMVPPPEVVSSAKAEADIWESSLKAVGSFQAMQRVTLSAELPGKITELNFESGAFVEKGTILVQLDIATEQAQLRAAESVAALAKINLERARTLVADETLPQSELDSTQAAYTQSIAEVDRIQSQIDKKTIRAPFSGRLGLREANLGQNLQSNQAIVSLQSLDPIYVNFLLPQQKMMLLKLGLTVSVQTDAMPAEKLSGTITAISPEIDSATRNIRVQATLDNPQEMLKPGMFADVKIVLPEKRQILKIPSTAVLYAPYGDSVFIVEQKKNEQSGENETVARQAFVRLGDSLGDFIVVKSGLEVGQEIVHAGVFKLRNGQNIVINNETALDYQQEPQPEDT